MLNTSAWREMDLRVLDELHLDTENVRLDNEDVKVEADILADLFANEGALSLVEGITKVGFLTHELPIVVKRRSKWVVVEGNRRIAALKAMQNPMLVPEYHARIKALTKGMPNLKALALVRVKIAPNQEQANELIAALHTSNPRRPWTPARQAAFFQAQINNGRSYTELRKRYPTVDVQQFVFRSHVFNLFAAVPYDDPELRDFVATKGWKRASSTLERIYQSKEFLDLTGMTMDDQGVFTTSLSDAQVKAVATVIVQGVKSNSLNTRTINTVKSPRFGALMTELRVTLGQPATPQQQGGASGGGAAPTPPSGGGRGGADGSGDATPPGGGSGGAPPSGGAAGGSTGGGTKPPTPPKKQQYLHIDLVVPDAFPTALKRQLEELTLVDVQRLPNTCYLAMRAFLEKSIKAFAECRKEVITPSVAGGAGPGYVQLHHALLWFEQYLEKSGPKPLVQPTRKVRTGAGWNWGSFSDTKAAMDAANHNHHFSVDPSDVLHLWDSVEPLLRELLKP
jgi:hypothetical protein